ncbi:MAG: hypothetical protein RL215_2782 [Planctomycetota bacterium]
MRVFHYLPRYTPLPMVEPFLSKTSPTSPLVPSTTSIHGTSPISDNELCGKNVGTQSNSTLPTTSQFHPQEKLHDHARPSEC